MRCQACGRESPDQASFCEVCGQPLRQQTTSFVQPAAEAKHSKWSEHALHLMIAGIAVGLLGGILYGASVVGEIAEWSEDPWAEDHGIGASLGLVLASYAIMAVGAALFLVGLIFLVLRAA
ncbi:MAG: zinc ribbon domain-containing protein [Thermoplasmata archaeon]